MNRSQIAGFGRFEGSKYAELLAIVKSDVLYHYAFLCMIVLLASVLRFYKLGVWSFWIDEVYSLQAAQALLQSGQYLQPSSVLLMSAAIQCFGVSEWSMRLAPAIVGLITLPVLYLLVRKLFDRHVALITTLLLAVSPWHLYWSQNARFYTTLLLFYLLALISFYWGLENDQGRLLVLSVVLLALAILERLFAAFLLPIFVSYVLLQGPLLSRRNSFFHLRKLFWVVAISVLLFALYEIFKLATAGESNLLSFLARIVGNPNKSSLRFLASFIYRVGIPTLCLGTAGGIYLIARKKSIGLYLLISAILPPLALTLAAPFLFTADRYAFVTLPSWIILSAVAIKELFLQSVQYARILALALPLIVVSEALAQDVLYHTYQNGSRHDWRSAYAIVEQQQQEGDAVIASRPEIGTYYLGRRVQGINRMDRQAVLQARERTWFVVNEELDSDQQRWLESHAELIQVLDIQIPGKIFMLRLYLYDPGRT